MKPRTRLATHGALTLLMVLLAYRDAHAYLDAGTGSYLLQLLLAGLLGALFAVKAYWKSLRTTLRNLFSRNRHVRNSESP